MPLLPSTKTRFTPRAAVPRKKPKPVFERKTVPSYTPAQQAGRDVRGVVQPVIAGIQADVDRQLRSGTGAIRGYTSELVKALTPAAQNLGAIYDQAQQRQAAVDAALSGGLTRQTNQDADALAGRLEAIGPTGQADQARQMGMGAAGALQGLGSAGVSQLIGEGAAASAYGAKLPEIARLGGLQSANMLQLAGQRETADRIGEVRARVPEMVLARTDQFRQNQAEREKLRLSQQIAAKEFGLDIAKFQQGAATDAERLALQAETAATRARQADDRLALDQARYAADLGYKNRKLAVEAAKSAKRNAAKKGITPTSYAKLRQQAAKDAERFYFGIDPTGKLDYENADGVGRLSYQNALAALMRRHSLKLVDAQGILDALYEPGELDRPYLSFQQRQALVRAGVPEATVSAAMWDEQAAAALLARVSR